METTKKLTPQERKDATAELREKHQPIFDALNISDALYIPKMAHAVSGLEGIYMGFFESELNHGQDVYTEMVSKKMESEDPTRSLYKWRYNPHFKEEYATSEPLSNGHVRYYIPMDEMILTEMPEAKEDFGIADPSEDPKLTDVTLRDLAALLLKEPVSRREWLNEIIRNTK